MKAAYIQNGAVHVGTMDDPVPGSPLAPVRTVVDPRLIRLDRETGEGACRRSGYCGAIAG